MIKSGNRQVLFNIIVVSFTINVIKCDIFTNPLRLLDLFKADYELANLIEASVFKSEFGFIKSFLDDRKEIQLEIQDVINKQNKTRHIDQILYDKMVSNPVHIFKLFKRTFNFSNEVLLQIQDNKNFDHQIKTDLIEKINYQMAKILWPTKEDLIGSIIGLVRSQYCYYLSPIEMARGKLGSVETLARLSSEDCIFIAEDRISGEHPVRVGAGKEYATAIEWIEAALGLATENHGPYSDQVLKISQFLTQVKKWHDEKHIKISKSSLTPSEEFFIERFADADKGETISSVILRDRERHEFSHRFSSTPITRNGYSVRDFYAVCRGETLKSDKHSNGIIEGRFCYVTDNGHPYLKLAPAKVEVVVEEPILYVFHDAFTETEMKIMKNLSATTINRSGLFNASNQDENFSNNERTQSNAWLSDRSNEILLKMSKRLDLFTGLQVSDPDIKFTNETAPDRRRERTTSEAWQVGAYGPGGLYFPHYDAFGEALHQNSNNTKKRISDRIATAMIYLSDVEGGGTGFPFLGTATFPRKGSFAFWFNLHRNGQIDLRTLHGACPTIFGIKWVSNKWILDGAQMFNRPCHLSKDL